MSHVQENIAQWYSKLNKLREEEKYTDVILQCKSKSFKCHRLVLMVASPYFEAMFESSFKESTLQQIVLEEVSAMTFEKVLQFIYTGHVDVNAKSVYDLLVVSNHLCLPGIEDLCLKFVANENLMTIENLFPLFSYTCHMKKNDFVSILSKLIAKHFSICCELKAFLEIPFNYLQIILEQYLLLPSRNEELLLAAIIRWSSHKREKRLQCLDEFLRMVQFESISPAYSKLITKMFITGRDPGTVALTNKLKNCDTLLEQKMKRILSTPNYLHVYVKYKKEKLIRIFSINCAKECMNSGEFFITDQNISIRCAVSDDLHLYCLDWIRGAPSVQNCERQTFCSYTSIDRSVTMKLIPPPIVFDAVSLCYMQNNIFAYNEKIMRQPLVRANSESCRMFNDEEINRGIYVYNCSCDDWFPVPQMKKLMCHAAMTVCENNLYLFGGSEFHQLLMPSNYMQAFDFRAGWRTLPPSHNNTYLGASCCSLGGKVYVCGGLPHKKNLERYDPIASKWETLQSMDYEAVGHRMIPYDDKLWVMGSFRLDNEKIYCPASDLSMMIYDVTENQWSKSSILTEAAAALIDEPTVFLDCAVFDIL